VAVKLSGTLPKGTDHSGMELLHRQLVTDPEAAHYVIAMIDCGSTKVDHEPGEGDVYTPTARILHIEPMLTDEQQEIVKELLGEAKARQTGGGQGVFSMGGED